MNEEKIVVSTTYNKNPDLAAEQLYNYDHFLRDQYIHVVHISKASSPSFRKELEAIVRPLINLKRVVVNPTSLMTNGRSGIAQHMENYYFVARELKINFNKFIIHTSSDLLVRGDFISYINNIEMAFNVSNKPMLPSDGWMWNSRCFNDNNFINLIKSCGLKLDSDLRRGRVEGAILPTEFVDYVGNKISEFYDLRSFANDKNAWPLDEVIFATLGKDKKGNSRKLIYTKNGGKKKPEYVINIQDIDKYCEKIKHPFGLKWFSTDVNDPARIYLKSLIKMKTFV